MTPSKLRLLAIAASPVFYQVPLYRRIAADQKISLKVVYPSDEGIRPYAAGFGDRLVQWDVDLLGGYEHSFLRRAHRNVVEGGFFALRDLDVWSELVDGRYDALWVHGYSYLTMWIALMAASSARVPVLIREDQTLLHGRPWPKRWPRNLILRHFFRSAIGLYVGSNNRAFFRHYGVPDGRLFWVPYCVDNEALQNQNARLKPESRHLRRRFGFSDVTGPVVLFVGKLVEKKQPLKLLKAFNLVRREYRCGLLFVGGGPLEGELRSWIQAHNVPDVRFGGFLNRSELPAAFAASDVFVLPSAFHETWGLVVNEAMNFSLPVVVSDKVGSGADLVEHQRNGYVVPAGDHQQLAEAIAALVSSQARREEFGRRSVEIVDRFSYSTAAAGVVDAAIFANVNRNVASSPLRSPDSVAGGGSQPHGDITN